MKLISPILLSLMLFTCVVSAADWPQFRGPNRDGKSPETGLLKQWPENGPKLLRTISGFGDGFSTPVIAGERMVAAAARGGKDRAVSS